MSFQSERGQESEQVVSENELSIFQIIILYSFIFTVLILEQLDGGNSRPSVKHYTNYKKKQHIFGMFWRTAQRIGVFGDCPT